MNRYWELRLWTWWQIDPRHDGGFMNYQEKNRLVNQIHAIRRELTTLENLIWSLNQEGINAETEPQERQEEEASGAQTPAPTQKGKP